MIFYYPNRPTLVPPDPKNPMNPAPDYINEFEASGKYIAEKKYNGDNVYYYTTSGEFWNRHKAKHRYSPSPEVKRELDLLPKDCVVNCELLNYRTKEIKDVLMAHCIMVWKGQLLTGKTWGDSRTILENEVQSGDHLIVSPIWKSGFWNLYQEADGCIIEGYTDLGVLELLRNN